MSQKYDLHFRNQLRNPILNSSRILRSFVWLWPKEITSKTILMGSRMVEDILHSLDSYWAFREGPKSEGFWHHLSCYHQRMRKFKMYLGWGKCDWKWGKVWKAASKTSFHTKYIHANGHFSWNQALKRKCNFFYFFMWYQPKPIIKKPTMFVKHDALNYNI